MSSSNAEPSKIGGQIAIICGELSSIKTSYFDNGGCVANVKITTKKPIKKKDGTISVKFSTCRASLWGKMAEKFSKEAKARDFDNKISGSLVCILSYDFGENKSQKNDSIIYTDFSVVKYRIFDNIDDWNKLMDANQDPSIIPVYSLLGIEK